MISSSYIKYISPSDQCWIDSDSDSDTDPDLQRATSPHPTPQFPDRPFNVGCSVLNVGCPPPNYSIRCSPPFSAQLEKGGQKSSHSRLYGPKNTVILLTPNTLPRSDHGLDRPRVRQRVRNPERRDVQRWMFDVECWMFFPPTRNHSPSALPAPRRVQYTSTSETAMKRSVLSLSSAGWLS